MPGSAELSHFQPRLRSLEEDLVPMKRALILALLLTGIAVCPGHAADGKVILPGMQEDGRILLPDGWTLDPVGRQVTLGDFPVNLALHPDGRHVAALHSGWGNHEVRVIDIGTGETVSQADIPESYYGLEFSPDGSLLYASGAATKSYTYSPSNRDRSGARRPGRFDRYPKRALSPGSRSARMGSGFSRPAFSDTGSPPRRPRLERRSGTST